MNELLQSTLYKTIKKKPPPIETATIVHNHDDSIHELLAQHQWSYQQTEEIISTYLPAFI